MESVPAISKEELFAQQNRILEFQVFKNSVILSEFLKFIINETIEGKSHSLKEYTIGVHVLSKKTGYDPQTDASVRIHAGRLRKALNQYYSGPGKDDSLIISIPKGTYVPNFDRKTSLHELAPDLQDAFYKPTLAVLPFHFSGIEELRTFADGLCDQICTEFSNFNELSVVSYYSSRKVVMGEIDLKDAGKLLDATFLLTGSMQSSGNQVRIRVQLIECNNQHQIWAATYDREKSELGNFTIQDDIVKHVINQIGGSHGIIFREAAKASPIKSKHDIKVYDAVFWYYHLVNDLNEPTFRKGLEVMKNTVKIDPSYAMGWAILGETYVAGFFYRFDSGVSDPLEEAVKCGQKSLKTDPLCQHAFQTLGLAYLFQNKRKECLQVISEWEKLNSKSTGIAGGLGFCLICAGEFERGYTLLCESIQVNPYYQWWFNAGLSFYHFYKKEFEDSLYWAEKIQGQSIVWELILKTASYTELGNLNSAQSCLDQLSRIIPDLSKKLRPLLGTFLLSEDLVAQLYEAFQKEGILKMNALKVEEK